MKLSLLTTIFTMSFTYQAHGLNILASKEGSFDKFDRCALSIDVVNLNKTVGTLEIKNGSKISLKETSIINRSPEKLERFALPALEGAQGQYYRWFPTQNDYKVRNKDNKLENFYSSGFINIDNNSVAAQDLILEMDSICDEQINDFRMLGKFQLNLEIGSRVFNDQLIIEREEGNFSGPIVKGRYIVPNSFESQIKTLTYEDGQFSFIIRVQEGNQDYQAIFEGSLNREGQLEGKSYILPERKL